ncbi:MAG: hypothetical protein K5644_03880, partial [Lachnospiraceae bacterium]|nr:hypothetical protein [Lachnospiraceae bacterium]
MTALFSLMTFSAIYFTSYRSLVNQSDEMLEKYMENYSPYTKFSTGKPDLPVNPDDLKEDGHMADGMLDQLSSFYSVAFNDVNGILSVDKGWNNLHSEKEIIKLAQGMLASDKPSGTYEHMLYRIDKRDGYTLVAFMDTLLMEESMRTVLISTVIVG